VASRAAARAISLFNLGHQSQSNVLGSAVSQVRPHFLRFAKTLHSL